MYIPILIDHFQFNPAVSGKGFNLQVSPALFDFNRIDTHQNGILVHSGNQDIPLSDP